MAEPPYFAYTTAQAHYQVRLPQGFWTSDSWTFKVPAGGKDTEPVLSIFAKELGPNKDLRDEAREGGESGNESLRKFGSRVRFIEGTAQGLPFFGYVIEAILEGEPFKMEHLYLDLNAPSRRYISLGGIFAHGVQGTSVEAIASSLVWTPSATTVPPGYARYWCHGFELELAEAWKLGTAMDVEANFGPRSMEEGWPVVAPGHKVQIYVSGPRANKAPPSAAFLLQRLGQRRPSRMIAPPPEVDGVPVVGAFAVEGEPVRRGLKFYDYGDGETEWARDPEAQPGTRGYEALVEIDPVHSVLVRIIAEEYEYERLDMLWRQVMEDLGARGA